MNFRRAQALAAILAVSVCAATAQSPTSEPYNVKASPLDDLSRELLTETGFVIREDGKVWDKIVDGAVRNDEMSYLLARLAGARRLKALLELNLILNRSEGEKKLSAAERENVRKLVRMHWSVFGVGTRRDFRSYFSVQELEELDRIPPRFDRGSALLMRDPDPVTATAVAPAPEPSPMTSPSDAYVWPRADLAAAPAPAPVQNEVAAAPIYRSVLTPFLEPLSLRRPSPFAPRPRPRPAPIAPPIEPPPPVAAAAPAPVPAPGPANPTIAALLSAMGSAPSSSQMVLPAPGARAAAPPAPAAAAPAPVPPPPSAPPLPVAAAPATTASPAIDNPGLGVLQTWTPPGVEAPSAQDALLPIPAPPAAPAPPAPRDASPAEFDAFLANGPYSREGQALLKILAEKAPDFCRAILRRTVVRGAPLIVFDGARTGLDRRAGFAPTAAGESPVIALSPGAVLVERRSGLFRRSLIAVPEDPRAWSDLGIPAPLAQAAVKDAVASSREAGAWGETKIYPDRSRRGSYTPQQQAGELLERLLLLGLEREGFASSTYAARAWARAARLLFSARIAEDYGNDSFLDPDRRLELREWIERGDEADDMLIAAWSSSRGNVLDPRRGGPESQARYERQSRESCSRALLADHLAEAARGFVARARTLEALNEGDLLSGDAAKKAAEKVAAAEAAARKALLASPPSCDGRFGADEAGLRRSAALLAEASRSERAFRERKMKGLGYAPRD